jgi:hypothetical protein
VVGIVDRASVLHAIAGGREDAGGGR